MIFNQLSQAVKAIMAARGYDIVAYLDDFLIVSDTQEKCLTDLNTLLTLLRVVVVVVVNLCFTSLFGTKGILSHIVIR